MTRIFIGCAGWSLRLEEQVHFDGGANHLARYATRFSAVEINSSFYRAHLPATYRRWADSVPDDFRFSVKLPKQITHVLRLQNALPAIDAFIEQTSHLGSKLGCVLIQLPPSLAFDAVVAEEFFAALRTRTQVSLVCEPRHPSWSMPDAKALLAQHFVGMVDTAPLAENDSPLAYFRLHGEPVMYRSPYSADALAGLAKTCAARAKQGLYSWCIFDNTAQGAAVPNALALRALLS